MLAPKRAEDDFAPGVGFAFGVLVAGFESSQLGVELVAFFAEDFEPIGGGFGDGSGLWAFGSRLMVAIWNARKN